MKNTIKSKLDYWEEEDKGYGYAPVLKGKLEAVSFESRSPINNKNFVSTMVNTTEWINGEGHDFSIHIYNDLTKSTEEKFFSLNSNELDGILFCLRELNYFE